MCTRDNNNVSSFCSIEIAGTRGFHTVVTMSAKLSNHSASVIITLRAYVLLLMDERAGNKNTKM
jgi:hypothetical protein